MLAPWDKDDTREVAKAAAVALATTAVTKLVEWGIEELRERLRSKDDDDGKQAADA